MNKVIGIAVCVLISQTVLAEEMESTLPAAEQSKPMLLESDAAKMESESTQAAATEETMKQEQSGFSRGSVVRSAFTREIDEREPMENLQNLSNENTQVKFFTELRDMSGQTAVHRWEYEGKVVAEIEFNVKGPRWRVWSSKSFVPQWTGDWKVSVINGAGEIISEKKLSYDIAAIIEPTTTIPAEETIQ